MPCTSPDKPIFEKEKVMVIFVPAVYLVRTDGCPSPEGLRGSTLHSSRFSPSTSSPTTFTSSSTPPPTHFPPDER